MNYPMKYSGIPWIGDIPHDWNLVQGKHIFHSHKRVVGGDVDKYERLALTMNGVIKRDKDDNEGLQPEQFEGYQILRTNELVFKLIDLQNIKTSRVGLSPYDGIVSPAYITLQNKSDDNRFYYYWYTFLYHYLIFNQLAGDGVRSALNADDLLKIPVPDIQYKKQKSISDFLDKKCSEIEKLVSLQEQIIEELKDYKQSVITEAVTKGLNLNVKTKESGIEWIGKIPETWGIVRVKYLLYECKERSENGTEEPLSMSQKYGLIPTKEMENIPNMASSFIGAKLVRVGDLVFNKLKAHLGVFSVSRYNGLVSPDYAVYHSTGKCNAKYLEYLFKTPIYINEFKKLSTGVGAGLTRLYTSDLFGIYAICPPLHAQEEIVTRINKLCAEIDKLIAVKQQKIEELKDYKKSLIYEYVTGKKQVI